MTRIRNSVFSSAGWIWLLLFLVGAAVALNALSPPVYGAGAGKVYWTDIQFDKISRANFGGSDREDVVTGPTLASHLAVDPGRKFYWADNGANKIQRADLKGTNVEDLVGGLSNPFGIAVEPAAPGQAMAGLTAWGLEAMAALLAAGAIYIRRRAARSAAIR